MKHKFLLDENILYDAFRGVNERDEPDRTARNLIVLIGQNCHSIVSDSEILRLYSNILEKVGIERNADQPVLSAFTQLMKNSLKFRRESEIVPELPPSPNVPTEDILIVRAARHFHAVLVAYEVGLIEGVKNSPSLKIVAIFPHEAILKAQET